MPELLAKDNLSSSAEITPAERTRILKEIENMLGDESLDNRLAAREEKIQAMRIGKGQLYSSKLCH